MDHSSKILKVLAYPAFKNADANPYNALLYREIGRKNIQIIECTREFLRHGDFDIFHVHWPEYLIERTGRVSTILSTRKTLSILDRVRSRGAKIIWTVHEDRTHEQRYPLLEKRYMLGMTRRLDGVISMSETGLKLARRNLPPLSDVPSFVIPHGHYRQSYPNVVNRAAARDRLSIPGSAAVIAYFGMIRPYKNVPALIRAFRQLEQPGTILVVAGKPQTEEEEHTVLCAANGNDSVRLALKRIEDDEVQLFLNAADLLVLPFKRILNSGSALLGLSFDLPILVPRLGSMAELQSAVGSNWVRTYEGELTADVLREATAWALHETRGRRAPLDDFDWSSVARQTVAAYRAVTGTMASPNREPA